MKKFEQLGCPPLRLEGWLRNELTEDVEYEGEQWLRRRNTPGARSPSAPARG